MCRAPAPQTRRMGPSQADPVGDVVWLHLVNIESKKLKAVIYALFHSMVQSSEHRQNQRTGLGTLTLVVKP